MKKEKEPIKLRKKNLGNGNVSLYLDTYINGKRTYEFLKLYLIPERNRDDKERNKQTMMLANAVKARRLVELQNGRFGFNVDNGGKMPFFAYYKHFASGKSGSYYNSTLLMLEAYETRTTIQLADITPMWVERFRQFLDVSRSNYRHHRLSENTKNMYYRCLTWCLNQAVKDGLIEKNPALGIAPPRHEDVERAYLTIEELKTLSATSYGHKEICNAFIFSCLTGLRFSDIVKLKWGDVQEDGRRIVFRMKKTTRLQYLDISEQARKVMGDAGEASALVFNLPTQHTVNTCIKEWVKTAGIKKHITFHCARHTFATLMLTFGSDIYTVSKLLGHASVKTTEIYAKIVDERKRKAVELIPDIM
jgi:integrase